MSGNVFHHDNNSCSPNAQNTVLKGLPFGGVPVVLLLNFTAVLVLLLLFSVMKKKPLSKQEEDSKSKRIERVKEKCGEDAFHYLRFQHHLIVLMLIMCVMSLCVVLPVNMSGDLMGHDAEMFGRTTIANLQERLLWLHTLVAVLYLGLMGALLRHYTSGIPRDQVRRVLFIYDIGKEATEEEIKQYFESLQEYKVYKVYLCYKDQDKNRQRVGENQQNEAEDPLKKKEKHLGMAFVIMQEEEMANKVLKHFNPVGCRSVGPWEPDPPNENLHVTEWKITKAAHPHNVYWENLSVQGFHWWSRYLIHFLLFIMLLLFTTPSIFISTVAKLNVTISLSFLISPAIKQFFPTLLLWMFSTLLPLIVYYSTKKEAHYTRSDENKSMIYKLYIFLLLMVLILPSLGITSLDVLYLLFDGSYEGRIKLECVFLPDQGAFFVNYVITSALSGAAMELLWFPRNVVFNKARECFTKKPTKNQEYRFPYGTMYAWNLCVFTVIMAYSITCPVIVPAGLMYLILKHLVDKHNLYYACQRSYLDRQVHFQAVNLAMAAPIICLTWLYSFSALQAGFMAWTTLFTLVVLVITITICFARICFGIFKQLSPHSCWPNPDEEPLNNEELIYKPPVQAHNQTSGTDRDPQDGPPVGAHV